MEVLDLEWDSSHAHGELSTLAVEQGYGGGGGDPPPKNLGEVGKTNYRVILLVSDFFTLIRKFPTQGYGYSVSSCQISDHTHCFAHNFAIQHRIVRIRCLHEVPIS